MKNLKNILAALSLLASLQTFAAQAPIPYPTQSATLSGMPTDLKLIITNLLTNFKKYDDAVKAINALYQTDKKFRTIVETTNPEWLINTLANNYACASKGEISKDLKIASIKNLLSSPEENWLKTAIAQENAISIRIPADDPLSTAIRQDNLEQIKKLIAEGYELEDYPGYNFKKIAGTLLNYRAEGMMPTDEKTLQVVQFLLDQGLDPRCFSKAFASFASAAAHMRSKKEKDLEIVKLLVSRGVNVNYKTYGQETALLKAIRTTHGMYTPEATAAIVTYLLEQKANPNIKDHQGKTALDWAEENRIINIIPILQKYGAKRGSELP